MGDYRMKHLAFIIVPLLLMGCETIYTVDIKVHSLKVSLSENVDPGSEEEPLEYIAGTSCKATSCPTGQACIGYCSDTGVTCATDDDCSSEAVCTRLCTKKYYVDIEAIATNGMRADKFSGTVHLSALPGLVPPSQAFVTIKDGKATGIPVYLAQAVGETRIWADHDGYVPRVGLYGECNDGEDNDGNGIIDLADPGCTDAHDGLEAPITYATGVSDPLYFESPTFRHLQFTESIIHSPLEGNDIYINSGPMVVTNVTSTGFFATDLDYQKPILDDGSAGYFNSMFVFTWSTPKNIAYGHPVCMVSGGVVEHEGNTQVKFPSFLSYWKEGAKEDPICQANLSMSDDIEVPDPILIPATEEELEIKLGDYAFDRDFGDTGFLACSALMVDLTSEQLAKTGGFDEWSQSIAFGDDTTNPCYMRINQSKLVEKIGLEAFESCTATELMDPEDDCYVLLDEADTKAEMGAFEKSLCSDSAFEEPTNICYILKIEDRSSPDLKDNMSDNARFLEPFENGLISLKNVQVSTTFIACDANGDDEITNFTDEDTCRDLCQEDPLCTQLEGFFKYSQWEGFVGEKRKFAFSTELVEDFSPLSIAFIGQDDQNGVCAVEEVWLGSTKFTQYSCPARSIAQVSGSLRHLYLCPKDSTDERCSLQFHTIIPRFDDDLVFDEG